jgi:protein arginine kinase activator
MVCQICKQREATIHFTNVVGSDVQKIHLCKYCAEEKGFDYLKKSNIEKSDLLSGLIDSSLDDTPGTRKEDRCGSCGMKYSAFKKNGMLGCSHCYEAFDRHLHPLLRSIHGNTRHTGKVPPRYMKEVSGKRKILELREELERVIAEENYERAAEIRDRIRELEEEQGSEKYD